MKERKPLRILFAEDLPSDAELAEKEIRKGGIEFTSRRVETKENFLKALEEFQPDVIVSDYRMPSFDGMQALRLSLKHDSSIPVIILTGSMNEETAVECLKAGAVNYVIKEHIARLPFAIKEALEQKKMRSAKEEVERALRANESSLQGILQSTADGILAVNKENKVLFANERFAEMWMIPQEVMATKDRSVLLQYVADQLVDPQSFLQRGQKLFKSNEKSFDTLYFKDGRIFERLSRPLLQGAESQGRVWSFRDITERKRAEKQITLLAHTVKSIIECVTITDMNDKILFANEAFLTTYGYDEREILGKDITIVRPPNNPPEELREIREATLAGGWHGEVLNRTKDGREFPVLLSTSSVRDDTGQVVGLVGVATDITERRQVEEALKQERALMDSLMNNIPDSIYFKDRQCRLVRINRKMMQDLKLDDVSQAIGKTDVELFGEEFGRTTLAIDERLMAMGKPIVGLTESRQLENGGVNWASTTKVPLRDDSGEIVGLVGITREINELMRAHEEREHERNLLRTLIDNLPDNIFIKDTESRFVVGNKAVVRQLGFAAEEELIGKTDFDFFPSELAKQFYAEEQAIIQSGKGIYDHEAPAADANKEEKDGWVSTTKVPLRDVQGKIMGIVGIGRYITERKRAEAALRDSEEIFRNFMEYSPIYVFFKDENIRAIRLSKNYEMMLGKPIGELLGKNMYDLFPSELAKSIVADDMRILKEGKEITVDEELNGRFYTTIKFPIHIEGKPRYLAGYTIDITERKRAEEELSKSEEKYRGIFDNVAEGIFQSTPDGKFLTVNPAMARILGFSSPEELIRERTDIARQSYVHPEQREEFKRLMEQQNKVSGFEYEVPREGGSIAWVSETAQAVRDATGRIVRYEGTFIDITERKRAEEKLSKSEEKYRGIFENVQDVYYETTIEGTILEISPSIEIMSKGQYHRDDLIGKSMYDFYSVAGGRQALLALLQERGSVSDYEIMLKNRDGSQVPCSISAKIKFDAQGAPLKIIGSMRDITERKQAEEVLAAERNLLRTLINNLPDRIYIKDVESRFLLNNIAHIHALGAHSQEEVMGKTDYDFRPQELADRYVADDRNVIETGEPLINREEPTIFESGERGWLLSSKVPLRDPEGKIIGLVGIARDITKPKKAEEALKKSEEQYRQFFEDDLTGDYVSTPEGKILSCNPAFARIYGFASVAEALKADTYSLYTEPEEREIFLRLLKERRKLEYYESEYLRSDGTHVYCVENAVGIFDQQENLVQIRGYIFDDTKRKTLERQLIQAQKLESLGTLASGIAHDFNNILGIILGYGALLTRGEPDPENIQNSADAIIRASQRGAALVKQLLTFARKVDVQLRSLRLNDIVNEISKLLGETFAKTIEISLHLEKDLPTITGDPTQIHQVLLNLCVNARDAMPKGGTIGITTCCQQGETIRAKFPRAVAYKYVVLSVADTGIGMDKRTLSRIFEPFYTTKEIGKGTGLGLSVVFGILEGHNGFVDVESEPSKGTTFQLYFPVLQTVDTEQAKAEMQRAIPGGNETILVVEDEEMLTRLLRTALQTAGYTVLVAVDGQEAVDLFDQHQDEIQLVLCDVGLPKLTGFDVFRKMRGAKPNLKFILASGFIEPQLKSEIFKEGVRDFVQKPYSAYEVLKSIRTILDQK